MKPALLVVFVVVAVISGESYHHSTTGACARVRAGADEGGGRVRAGADEGGGGGRRGEREARGKGEGGRGEGREGY